MKRCFMPGALAIATLSAGAAFNAGAEDSPSLRNASKDDFLIGAAVNQSRF